MRIDGGDVASNYQLTQPAPQTYTAQAHDTVTSIAQAYKIEPEELARANGISINTELQQNQVLTLPANATQPSKDDAAPTAQTPAQKTDAAVAAYEAAVKQGAQTADIAQAKAAMDKAIGDEIGGQIANRNAGVPGEFQTPADQLINEFGQSILQRHQGDAAAQSGISSSIRGYRATAKADALIPTFSGPWSAADKLKQIDLRGQPPEVVDAVLADPRVQGWINDAAKDIDKPYNGVKAENYDFDPGTATQAAANLASATEGLSPELATAVTQASLPTIQKIAQLQPNTQGGGVPFQTVHGVLSSLGDSPQAKAVIDQVAGYYASNRAAVNFLTADAEEHAGVKSELAGTISGEFGNGNVNFAIALAEHLQTTNPVAAKAVLNAAEGGLEQFLGRTQQDINSYKEITNELGWVVNNAGPAMTPDELQKATENYVKSKGPQWQKQLGAARNNIVADAHALASGIAQLKHLPVGLDNQMPDLNQRVDKNIVGSDTAQKAFQFALKQDPGMFAGGGADLADAMVGDGQTSKGLIEDVTKAYVAGHVLPQISNLNPNDPASVSSARQAINDLRNKARIFGISQSDMDQQVDKLNTLLDDLKTESLEDAIQGKGVNALGAVKNDLSAIAKSPFDTGAAGFAFRAIAFDLSGTALTNSAQQTSQSGKVKDALYTLALAVNTGQDGVAFLNTVNLLDSSGKVGQWGDTNSIPGDLTAKFANALYGTYYLMDLADNWGNVPKASFDGVGIAGAGASVFGEELGLGSLAGPVGTSLLIVATVGLGVVDAVETKDQHTAAAKQFMTSGGVSADIAKVLSNDAMQESSSLQNGLQLSATDLRALAQTHPELFQSPGAAKVFVAVAQACGIQGGNTSGFADALSKDDPHYIQTFLSQSNDGMHPLSYKADLVNNVIQGCPNAKAYLQTHNPGLLSADADTRRKADRDLESALGFSNQDQLIGNLLKGNSNAVYQAEIIHVLQQRGSLDHWVDAISPDINGWPQAAKVAIQDAQNAGVLSVDDANKYLAQLAG